MTPATAPVPASTLDTRDSAQTDPMPEPAPSSSLLKGPSIRRPPPLPGTLRRPPHPSPPPPTPQPPPTQPPHPPPTRHPRPAHHNPSRRGSLPNGPPNLSQPQAPPPPPRPTPRRSPRPQPGQNPRPPPNTHQSLSTHRGLSLLLNRSPSPSPAPRRQREPNPTRKSSTASGPGDPRPGSSSAKHGAAKPSRTPPPPPSWRSAPRPRHDAPHPATPQSPHARPTDHPSWIKAAPGPTSSVPAPLPTPDVSPHPADAPLPPPPRIPTKLRSGDHVPMGPHTPNPPPPTAPRQRTTRTPPGPPPPPVPMTPPHTPTPTPPPKATAPPRDSGGSAGPTHSSGSCESGPGQSPPSGAWPAGPERGRRRTAASSRRGSGCYRPHGKPCWPMRSIPGDSVPANSPHPKTTRMSSDACRRPSKRREWKPGGCGTSPPVQPHAHTPPCHPASVEAQTLAAAIAPRGPRAPHSMTRLTPRPVAPPSSPKGGYSLGRAQTARR